ncbi:gluconate 2-dehydrogenase subunit 3 family protein [Halioglobus maricola]|uniref:Gluconate 2-dehydrogenase subunit 3 family protein n=1 Tax=Halioglobus maricola TaxID=2601894 RepID=A0A5P9NLY6_9GAMM|nr:gluconate 2-dehydrogenase subunit 3 family protein [Halioglobus maricola]QFU76873.1 gluconate 2-dehydrogenase subunit 3 family protein [Halioglobus maricola]
MSNIEQQAGLTRRQSLKWLAAVTATITTPLITGCEATVIEAAKLAGRWPDLQLDPIVAPGYGTDPALIAPAPAPWPLTMTPAQRRITTTVLDLLIPRENEYPSASEAGVVELVDEWISAPYPEQQETRPEILSALVWFDEESQRRYDRPFTEASMQQQLAIFDDIAYEEAESKLQYAYISRVFDGLRTLASIAYFSSPEGVKDMGYVGNVPIAGDYPGPTPEAMQHLEKALAELGLSEHAYG